MTKQDSTAAFEENVDVIINHYGKVAHDFGMAKGFLLAAIGHAAVTMDDRAPLHDVLLAAATEIEAGKSPSQHSRPSPWDPKGGDTEVTQLAVGKMAAMLSNRHSTNSPAERDVLNASAVRAGLIMIAWHDPRAAAAAIRTFAGHMKDLP
jgi:hypothetical protein